jgi:cbb3-type cytochrome oxidase subunit 3
VSSSAVAEAAGHGVHLVLFGAGLVAVAVLLWVARPRRRGRRERARVRALRAAARAGTVGTAAPRLDD